MDELFLIQLLSYLMIIMGLLTFHQLTTGGQKAPYGRYFKADRILMSIQLEVNTRLAWFLQELPSFAVAFYFAYFTDGKQYFNYTNKFVLWMFISHYFQR